MTILNIGSINLDHFYRVARHPAPGETLADKGYASGLGGKGANMSVAAAMAGAKVHHCGCIGAEGGPMRDRIAASGADVSLIAQVDEATGHAIIMVDDAGENVIIIHSGANRAFTEAQIEAAIATCSPGDWLILQNETNLAAFAAQTAKRAGMKVAYAAAPYDPVATTDVLPYTDLLAVNEVEAAQLAAHIGVDASELPVEAVLVTLGGEGAAYRAGGQEHRVAAFPVTPVDTTGAGDTFFGFFVAGLDMGRPVEDALRYASAAAAIQITRPRHGGRDPGGN